MHIRPSITYESPEIFIKNMYYGKKGAFIDIGAFKPDFRSIGGLMHELGFLGALVEPSEIPYQLCKDFYRNHSRIQIFNHVVSDIPGHTVFYDAGGDSISTNNQSYAESWIASGVAYRTTQKSAVTVSELLKMSGFSRVEFINIGLSVETDRVLHQFDVEKLGISGILINTSAISPSALDCWLLQNPGFMAREFNDGKVLLFKNSNLASQIFSNDVLIHLGAGAYNRWRIKYDYNKLLHRPYRNSQTIIDRQLVLFARTNPRYKQYLVCNDEQLTSFPVVKAPPECVGLNSHKFLSSTRLWSRKGRTLLIYGDVFFMPSVVDIISRDQSPDIRFYGSKKFGELFAVSIEHTAREKFASALEEVVRLEQQGLTVGGGWRLLRHLDGLSCEPEAFGDPVAEISDRYYLDLHDGITRDFDSPEEYDNWLLDLAAQRVSKDED